MTWQLNRNFGTGQNYVTYRNTLIQMRENVQLFQNRGGNSIHPGTSTGNPTLGFGYDLAARGPASVVIGDLRAAGISLTNAQVRTITDWKAGQLTNEQALGQLSGLQVTRAQADALFDRIIQQYENRVDDRLSAAPSSGPGSIANQLRAGPNRESVERAVLVDLAYQSASFIGPKTLQALAEGNRAALWFEIRYGNTRGDQNDGTYKTSDTYWNGLDARFRARAEALGGLNLDTSEGARAFFNVYLGRQDYATRYIRDFAEQPASISTPRTVNLSNSLQARSVELIGEAQGLFQQAARTLGFGGDFDLRSGRITYTPLPGETLTYLDESFRRGMQNSGTPSGSIAVTGTAILVANPGLVGSSSLPEVPVALNLPNRTETLAAYMMDMRPGGVPTDPAAFYSLSTNLQLEASRLIGTFANGVTPSFQRLESGGPIPANFQGYAFTAPDGTVILVEGRLNAGSHSSRNFRVEANGRLSDRGVPRCFLAGTPILMADGQEKPIEDIRVGDMVMSFDPSADQGRGALVPKPVSRTFQNITRSIIDLRGLHMTPGHVCLTDDGRFETIAEILLRDGILIEADGTPIRARTGAKVGSMEDTPVLIAYPDEKTGKEIFVRARAGIPCRLIRERDGTKRHLSLALMLRAYHQTLTPDGLILSPDGSLGEATDWPEDSTPMDEDYRRNWVIQTADGKPYVPEWIVAVAEEAREEQTVGATLQRIISPPSQRFTPRVVSNTDGSVGSLKKRNGNRNH